MKQANDLQRTFQKAYTLHKAGKFSQAEKNYRELLEKKPEWGQPMGALGILYLDRNQPDKAKPLFEKAAGLNLPDLSACYQLGRLKQLENDHQGAIPLYKKMLEQQPQSGLAWNNLGVAYRETGQPDDAMASFRAAVRFAPEMAAAWNNLGVALDEQGETQQALAAYNKAIEIQPEYVSPHLNIGIMLQKSKRFKAAQVHYRAVLESQPENEIAKFMLQSIGRGGCPSCCRTGGACSQYF